jgi:hypothetical protein
MGKLLMQKQAMTSGVPARSAAAAGAFSTAYPRLEIIDPFHRDWSAVLALISRRGHRRSLMLDTDGWLSARQSVIAAFLDGRVIGFLIFHVEPVRTLDGQLAMSAQLDALSTEGAAGDGRLGRQLDEFARSHAADVLNCRFFDAAGPNVAMAA